MFVWRDSIELRIADTFAIIVILGVLFLPTLKITARIAGRFPVCDQHSLGRDKFRVCRGALFGADIKWGDLPMTGWRKHAFAVFSSPVGRNSVDPYFRCAVSWQPTRSMKAG
jgi:hypothetical protein